MCYEREQPFDHTPGPLEVRNATVATQRTKDCIAYIREHRLTGERLETWRGMIRDWLRERRWYRRAERGCYDMNAPFPKESI